MPAAAPVTRSSSRPSRRLLDARLLRTLQGELQPDTGSKAQSEGVHCVIRFPLLERKRRRGTQHKATHQLPRRRQRRAEMNQHP